MKYIAKAGLRSTLSLAVSAAAMLLSSPACAEQFQFNFNSVGYNGDIVTGSTVLTTSRTSPGIYHVTDASGNFTSEMFGGGKITGVTSMFDKIWPHPTNYVTPYGSLPLQGGASDAGSLLMLTTENSGNPFLMFINAFSDGGAIGRDGYSEGDFTMQFASVYSFTPIGAPEIDGDKLPLALMLLGLLLLITRRGKLANLIHA